MLQSFIIYSIFGFSLFFFGQISYLRENIYKKLKRYNSFWTWDIILVFLIFAFVSGVRWKVGVDYIEYLNNYLSVQKSGLTTIDKESGFEYLTLILAKLNIHFSFYFGFLAFLQIFFIYRAFKDERYLYPFIGIVIVFGSEYINWMNGIRQTLAATMFVYSIQFINKRKFFHFSVIILLASLMHTSALILFLFYFIPQKDYFKNRILVFVLIAITMYFGNNNSWIYSLKNLGSILDLLNYENISTNLDSIIEEKQIRLFGPRRFVLLFITILIILFSKKLKSYYKNTLFLSYYNYSILGFLLYNLLQNTHHLFIRPLYYLIIFNVIVSSYLLFYLKTNFRTYWLSFILALILCLSYLPISIVAEYEKGNNDFTNYKFYWDYYKF